MYVSNVVLGLLLAFTGFGNALDIEKHDVTSLARHAAVTQLPISTLTTLTLSSHHERCHTVGHECHGNEESSHSPTSAATYRPEKCGPKHKKKSCEQGDCCSANGKCGRSEAFCGKHCQSEFGSCWNKQVTKAVARPVRCGKAFNDTKCAEGYCCSGSGWCGKGASYCSVPFNCQVEFGSCDSDAVPEGMELLWPIRPYARFGDVLYGKKITSCKKPSIAALTFDDGPSNNTMEILDVLRDYGAKATFFLTGNNDGKGMIDENEVWISTVKRIIDEGHQIGSHTWTHQHLDAISNDSRIYEMVRNDRAIANIIGKYPTYMRAPYLECSEASGCLKDMSDLGYHVIEWDVDSHDWEPNQWLVQLKATIDRAMDNKDIEDNMLLIQHDHNQYAVELTKYVLDKVQKKNWQAVTVGECMYDPETLWYVDLTWIEPKAIAGGKGVAQGCVVSRPGFCGEVLRFEDRKSCSNSLVPCVQTYQQCTRKLGSRHLACDLYSQYCTHLALFCGNCEERNQPICKSDNLLYEAQVPWNGYAKSK